MYCNQTDDADCLVTVLRQVPTRILILTISLSNLPLFSPPPPLSEKPLKRDGCLTTQEKSHRTYFQALLKWKRLLKSKMWKVPLIHYYKFFLEFDLDLNGTRLPQTAHSGDLLQ